MQKLESGASLFSGKMGEKLFSGALTLQVDRRPESWLPFFDAEGSVLEGDTLPLIENGVLVRGAADRAQAARYGCMATAAAGGAYDAAPAARPRRAACALHRHIPMPSCSAIGRSS